MDGNRFELLLVESETGIVLDAQGEYSPQGSTPFRPSSATREAALAAKDDLLQRFPFAEVWVKDRDGVFETERFTDEAAWATYNKAMNTWRRWYFGSWIERLFAMEPPNPRRRTG